MFTDGAAGAGWRPPLRQAWTPALRSQLRPLFLRLEFVQQKFETIERLRGIWTVRFENDVRAAIEVRREHFHDAPRGEFVFAFLNENIAIETMHRAHELRRGSRVKAEVV